MLVDLSAATSWNYTTRPKAGNSNAGQAIVAFRRGWPFLRILPPACGRLQSSAGLARQRRREQSTMRPSVQPRPEYQAFWGTTRLKGPIPALTPREQAVSFLISGMPDDLRAVVRDAFLGPLPWSLWPTTPPATQSPQHSRPDETALDQKLKLIRSCIEVELEATRRVLTAPAHAMSRMTRNCSLVIQGAELRRLFQSLAAALDDPQAALDEFEALLDGVG